MESEKKAADLAKAHKKSSCFTTFSGGTQMTLDEIAGGRKYGYGSEKYQCITKKLAIFIGSTNTPISIVEDDTFKSFTLSLDSRYDVPG